jgi:hypothetical protein
MTDTEKRLVEAIRSLQANGTTLEEFAVACGTYKQNVSAFMLGKRDAQIRWIEVCCSSFGFDPSWLILGKPKDTTL